MLFGSSPPDHDKSDKKGAFDWFHKRRQDHKERLDRRERAKSPPGSSSHLPSPQNMMNPQESFAVRGRAPDVPPPVEEPQPKADKSSDVTPTGMSPTPPNVPTPGSPKPRMSPAMALRTDLPAALTEPRSVARSPDRNSKSPVTTTPPVQPFAKAPSPLNVDSTQQVEASAATQPEASTTTSEPIQPVSTPSGPLHSSSNSTTTVTPQTVNRETNSDAPSSDGQSSPPFVPRGEPAP